LNKKFILFTYYKGSNQAVAAGRLLAGDRVLFAGQMGKDDKATGLEKGINMFEILFI